MAQAAQSEVEGRTVDLHSPCHLQTADVVGADLSLARRQVPAGRQVVQDPFLLAADDRPAVEHHGVVKLVGHPEKVELPPLRHELHQHLQVVQVDGPQEGHVPAAVVVLPPPQLQKQLHAVPHARVPADSVRRSPHGVSNDGADDGRFHVELRAGQRQKLLQNNARRPAAPALDRQHQRGVALAVPRRQLLASARAEEVASLYQLGDGLVAAQSGSDVDHVPPVRLQVSVQRPVLVLEEVVRAVDERRGLQQPVPEDGEHKSPVVRLAGRLEGVGLGQQVVEQFPSPAFCTSSLFLYVHGFAEGLGVVRENCSHDSEKEREWGLGWVRRWGEGVEAYG